MNGPDNYRDGGLYRKIFYPGRAYIPHYYGDIVRGLFIAATLLMLVSSPLYAESLRTALPVLVIAAVVLIALAALTNPRSVVITRLNAAAAGVGVIVFEIWALMAFNLGALLGFVLLEAVAILFVFAFYFSLKTLRAMIMGLIGNDEPDNAAPLGDSSSEIQSDALFDEYGEPVTDAFGHRPALEDDRGDS